MCLVKEQISEKADNPFSGVCSVVYIPLQTNSESVVKGHLLRRPIHCLLCIYCCTMAAGKGK